MCLCVCERACVVEAEGQSAAETQVKYCKSTGFLALALMMSLIGLQLMDLGPTLPLRPHFVCVFLCVRVCVCVCVEALPRSYAMTYYARALSTR